MSRTKTQDRKLLATKAWRRSRSARTSRSRARSRRLRKAVSHANQTRDSDLPAQAAKRPRADACFDRAFCSNNFLSSRSPCWSRAARSSARSPRASSSASLSSSTLRRHLPKPGARTRWTTWAAARTAKSRSRFRSPTKCAQPPQALCRKPSSQRFRTRASMTSRFLPSATKVRQVSKPGSTSACCMRVAVRAASRRSRFRFRAKDSQLLKAACADAMSQRRRTLSRSLSRRATSSSAASAAAANARQPRHARDTAASRKFAQVRFTRDRRRFRSSTKPTQVRYTAASRAWSHRAFARSKATWRAAAASSARRAASANSIQDRNDGATAWPASRAAHFFTSRRSRFRSSTKSVHAPRLRAVRMWSQRRRQRSRPMVRASLARAASRRAAARDRHVENARLSPFLLKREKMRFARPRRRRRSRALAAQPWSAAVSVRRSQRLRTRASCSSRFASRRLRFRSAWPFSRARSRSRSAMRFASSSQRARAARSSSTASAVRSAAFRAVRIAACRAQTPKALRAGRSSTRLRARAVSRRAPAPNRRCMPTLSSSRARAASRPSRRRTVSRSELMENMKLDRSCSTRLKTMDTMCCTSLARARSPSLRPSPPSAAPT
mmetsp:Transcript_24295/g.83437  ORF Transcript_24295/g.83437 Transcript_24295/m.83437 type:complete len:611 (-) Transcript_24295:124-1956(-)